MSDLQKYRKISLDFRRSSSNMLNSKYDDDLLYLIRFKEFIDKNDAIQEILNNLWIGLPENYSREFIIKDKNTGWNSINAPINEAEHLKLIYDYLNTIIEEDMNLAGVSRMFLFTSSRKFNDNIRAFLNKVFKPLVDYINDQLSQKIIELTGLSQNMPQITQNIENNYGTTSAVGNGSISSVNTISMDNDSIEKLCSDVLSELIKSNFLSNDDKEVVIDDVETIRSEMSSSNPKRIKIKKAWISIQAILHKIPTGITVATQLMDLCDRVSQLF